MDSYRRELRVSVDCGKLGVATIIAAESETRIVMRRNGNVLFESSLLELPALIDAIDRLHAAALDIQSAFRAARSSIDRALREEQ